MLGDPVLNTWILWWNTQAFPLSEQWWSAPAFFPVADTLAFSENLLGLFPISGPMAFRQSSSGLQRHVPPVVSAVWACSLPARSRADWAR